MLLMFRTAKETTTFIEFVHGCTFVSLLVETATVALRLHEAVKLLSIGEIHYWFERYVSGYKPR